MPQSIENIQNELNIAQPFIGYNGAIIVDENGNTIEECVFETDVIEIIQEVVSTSDVALSYYSGRHWIVTDKCVLIDNESRIIGVEPEIGSISSKIHSINKVLCIGELQNLIYISKNLAPYDRVRVEFSKPDYLEITPSNVSKLIAMKRVLNHYNIELNKTIAIGDGKNDIEILRYANLGIAMGNAPSEVKSIADFVTLSNDEDGFATAIYERVLE
jgi:Cof subfamily protein (haloacid dehalogenase superfamily)